MSAAIRLDRREVAKEWGVDWLSPPERIGEIHFAPPPGPAARLLVKHLHTSAPLSVQVHPRHDSAGKGGKDEAWFVLAAEPGARIGLGLSRPLDPATLRAAAEDGSLVDLIDWRAVAPGNFLFCPTGTIHCIGAGVSLIEIQENVDVTYRLFDHGRDRPLHLDESVEAAILTPNAAEPPGRRAGVMVECGSFTVERWQGEARFDVAASPTQPIILAPLAEGAAIAGSALATGEVYCLDAPSGITAGRDADLLIAYSGGYRAGLRPRA
jgi:mannose-6-phosphate isomerase